MSRSTPSLFRRPDPVTPVLERLREEGHKVSVVWTSGRNAWRVRVVRMERLDPYSAATPRRQYVQAFGRRMIDAVDQVNALIAKGAWRTMEPVGRGRWS